MFQTHSCKVLLWGVNASAQRHNTVQTEGVEERTDAVPLRHRAPHCENVYAIKGLWRFQKE